MVFSITAGMGGGSGKARAAPVIANVLRKVWVHDKAAVVTRPFGFEGNNVEKFCCRRDLQELREQAIPFLLSLNNNLLLEIVDKKTPLLEALSEADNVLRSRGSRYYRP